jgi:hypothetical protein
MKTNDENVKHKIITLDSISKVSIFLNDLVVNQKRKVLLVSDLDNTIIRPISTIGSDVWFWYSQQNEHVDDVIDKLSMLYAILQFQSVETKETDRFVETIDELSSASIKTNTITPIKYFCLTARNVKFHGYTIMHLHKTNYDKVLIRPNMLEFNKNMYIMMKENSNIPIVRYIDNICFTSGEDKGTILSNILKEYSEHNKTNDEFDLLLFIDDSKTNIDSVHSKLSNTLISNDLQSVCIHYTYMEKQKNEYSMIQHADNTKKMDKLIKIKKEINNKPKYDAHKLRYNLFILFLLILLINIFG